MRLVDQQPLVNMRSSVLPALCAGGDWERDVVKRGKERKERVGKKIKLIEGRHREVEVAQHKER